MVVKRGGITLRYYIFSFLTGLTFYTAVLVPFYTEWGRITLTQVQFLQAWFMFWSFILEIPTGTIADRFGRKFSVVLGCLMAFTAFMIYGSFPFFIAFLLSEFLAALGVALISGAGEALLYDSLKEEDNERAFKKVFGRSYAITQLAIIISAAAGGLIADKFGLNIPMLATAFPVITAAFILVTVKEPKLKVKIQGKMKYLKIAQNGITNLIRNPLLMKLVLNGIFVYIGAYFLIWLYQPLLQNFGVPIVYFGIIRALFAFSCLVFTQNLQRTEKWFGSGEKFFKITGVITIISLLLVAVIPSIVTVLIAIIVIGGLGQTRFANINPYMNDIIPSNERATTLSAVSMVNRLVLILLNPLVGFIADHSIRMALLFVCSLSLAALIFIPLSLSKVHEDKITELIENEVNQ